MFVTHKFDVLCRCPVDGQQDVYRVSVVPPDPVLPGCEIMCEDILDAARTLAAQPLTQEAFTQGLANAVGCSVATQGVHCGGQVCTVCMAVPASAAADPVSPADNGRDKKLDPDHPMPLWSSAGGHPSAPLNAAQAPLERALSL